MMVSAGVGKGMVIPNTAVRYTTFPVAVTVAVLRILQYGIAVQIPYFCRPLGISAAFLSAMETNDEKVARRLFAQDNWELGCQVLSIF